MKRSVYLGVDPSAASLHVGNLLALIGLLHFKLQGHTSIALVSSLYHLFPVLFLHACSFSFNRTATLTHSLAYLYCQIGGATGSVGDPSGRSTERQSLDPVVLASNIASITSQVTTFLDRGVPFALSRTNKRYGEPDDGLSDRGEIKVVDNLEWLGGMGLLEFLSGVGKTARMATMLSRDRYVTILHIQCMVLVMHS